MTGSVDQSRGMLDTSTVILLGRLADAGELPNESVISAITLAELSVGPHVARTDAERSARQPAASRGGFRNRSVRCRECAGVWGVSLPRCAYRVASRRREPTTRSSRPVLSHTVCRYTRATPVISGGSRSWICVRSRTPIADLRAIGPSTASSSMLQLKGAGQQCNTPSFTGNPPYSIQLYSSGAAGHEAAETCDGSKGPARSSRARAHPRDRMPGGVSSRC